VGLGISRTYADSQWNPVYNVFQTYFIEIFVVETKRFVGSFVNVILTRQTCGQRSKWFAESKRRALGNYFSERSSYMFLMSKCRGDQNLGLCTTSVLAFKEPQRNGKILFFLRRNTFFPRFVSTTKISMKCVVNWIPLRIRVRSTNTQPHLNLVESGPKIGPATGVTAEPIRGPLFTRLIEGLHFENCLTSRLYYVSDLVGKKFPTKEHLTRIRTNVFTVSFPKRIK